jgi:hypothetical protein
MNHLKFDIMAEDNLNIIPSRVKHYLLDFKDMHYNQFYDWYKKESLKSLTLVELADMLEKVSIYDTIEILNDSHHDESVTLPTIEAKEKICPLFDKCRNKHKKLPNCDINTGCFR